jgi:hypothetical protein
MVFSMGQYVTTAAEMQAVGINATAEIDEANDPSLQLMRLFTIKVGQHQHQQQHPHPCMHITTHITTHTTTPPAYLCRISSV